MLMWASTIELLRGLQREVAQLVGIIDRLEDRPIELNPGAELVSASDKRDTCSWCAPTIR